MWPSGGRVSQRMCTSEAQEKEEMLPTVYLEPQQADLPEAVQGSILHEELIGHDSTTLQT